MPPFFTEPCIVIQDDQLSEPLVLLRKYEGAEVEVLTVEQAHALLDNEIYAGGENASEYWWNPLVELLEGIR